MYLTIPTNVSARIFFFFFSELANIKKNVRSLGFCMLEKNRCFVSYFNRTKKTKGIPAHTSISIDKEVSAKL